MVPIKLAQYANEDLTLVYVQYEDGVHKYVLIDAASSEAAQLRAWVAAGNVIAPYQPVISGGVVPVAAIMWFCSPKPPAGYLLCDGRAVPRGQYAQLFRAIGTLYGGGDGQTTFNLPNLVGRFCRGWGPVSPLDPARQFGSYQEDGIGEHTHSIPAILHNHTITDPGHTHGVSDPGHSHSVTDPGHVHPVTDPGHRHTMSNFSHVGYAALFNIFNNGSVKMQAGGSFTNYYYYYFNFNSANFIINNAEANLIVDLAQSNVLTESAVTGITVDDATSGIPFTELTGGSETRPDNIALLPVIRY